MKELYPSRTVRKVDSPPCSLEGDGDQSRTDNARVARPRVSGRPGEEIEGTLGRQDLQVVQRAVSGDSDALTKLFARDRQRLFRLASALLHNNEDAEDALQDAFLSAYVNLKSFEGRSHFSTWLTRIVVNSALMYRRRQQTRRHLWLQDSDICAKQWLSLAADRRPDPERTYASVEARGVIESQISELSPLLRSAFYLRHIGQLSAFEASEVARTRVSTIKSRTTRARQRLAHLLQAEGIRC
jgi:RNA polymerase sigma factor (sigma-70 family)